MAGMLPGVEMPRRRAYQGHPSHRSSWHKPPTTTVATTTTTTTMDGTAIIARHRLAEKLCYFSPSRSSQENESRGNNTTTTMSTKDGHEHLVSRILGRHWHFKTQNNKNDKSEMQVCAVCLEDFVGERRVMELSCSHKYHPECLQPWLATHPNCPSCRTAVVRS